MSIRQFKTWEEDGKIYVYMSVEEWNEPRFPKILIETVDLLKILEGNLVPRLYLFCKLLVLYFLF